MTKAKQPPRDLVARLTRLEPELDAKLCAEAEQQERSVAAQMRVILRERYEGKSGA